MLKLHHDLTSPQGETSSVEYCLSFCFGNLWYFLGTFCKLSTGQCNDSAFGALGCFIQRYPRVTPQKSRHRPGELEHWDQRGDAPHSVGRIWPERFLFDFSRLMSVPAGEDRGSVPEPNTPPSALGAACLLHPPRQPALLTAKALKSGSARDPSPAPAARGFPSRRCQVSCPRCHLLSPTAASAGTTRPPPLWALLWVPEVWVLVQGLAGVHVHRPGGLAGSRRAAAGRLGRRGRPRWKGCTGNYLPYCALACV